MLKVEGVILSLFQLIMGVPSKLTPDTINKSFGVPQIFLEECLKLKSFDQSGIFVAVLMLGSSKAGSAAEENGSK